MDCKPLKRIFDGLAGGARKPPDIALSPAAALLAKQMDTTFLSTSRDIMRNVWLQAKPYLWSDTGRTEKAIAYGLIASVLAMTAANVLYVDFHRNELIGNLGDLMQEYFGADDKGEYANRITDILKGAGGLVLMSQAADQVITFLLFTLQGRWAFHKTHAAIDAVTHDNVAFKLQNGPLSVENPFQRIGQDNRDFVNRLTSLTQSFWSKLCTLTTFSMVLWSMPGTINMGFLGLPGLEIPHVMFALGVVVPAAATAFSFWLAKKLPAQEYRQEAVNADLDASLVDYFNNAESIALAGEQVVHRHVLKDNYNRSVRNMSSLVSTKLKLEAFKSFYDDISPYLPYAGLFLLKPTADMTIGFFTKGSEAFLQIQNSLNVFINNFSEIARLGATAQRLTEQDKAIAVIRGETGAPRGAPMSQISPS